MSQAQPERPFRDLTQSELAAFSRDGVICVRGAYSKLWIAMGLSGIERVISRTPVRDRHGLPDPNFRNDATNWHSVDEIRDFALFGPGAHLVRQALQSETLNFLGDQIFVKNASTPLRAPWHHDLTFFPIVGNQCASIWVTFDSVIQRDSALEFVAGSHLWGRRFQPEGVGGIVKSLDTFDAVPDIQSARHDYEILGWDLEPGDALIFHALTLHGSSGNGSDQKRRALATRWCGDDVAFKATGNEMRSAWAHGLKHGDRLAGPSFPRVLPEIDLLSLEPRMRGPVAPDPVLAKEVAQQQSQFSRIKRI